MDTLKNKWFPAKVIGGLSKNKPYPNRMTYKISVDGFNDIYLYHSKKDNAFEKGMNVLVQIKEDSDLEIEKIKTAWDFSKITAVKLFLIKKVILILLILIFVLLNLYLTIYIEPDFFNFFFIFVFLIMTFENWKKNYKRKQIIRVMIMFSAIILSLSIFIFGSKTISGNSQEMVYFQNQNKLVEKFEIPYIDIVEGNIPKYTIVSIAEKNIKLLL